MAHLDPKCCGVQWNIMLQVKYFPFGGRDVEVRWDVMKDFMLRANTCPLRAEML